MKNPKVTIIIPSWNRQEDLIENIKSIKRSTYDNFSIVIVDDCSTDSSKEVLEKLFPDVTVLRNKKNLGAAKSRNVGLKFAKKTSDYILFLDSDVVIDNKAIALLVETLSQSEGIGAVTPTVFYFDDPKKVQYAHVGINLWTGVNKSDPPLNSKVPYQTQLCGGNFMIKVAVVKKVGYFDPLYKIYYEDADYSMRVRKAGFKIFYVPPAKTWHKMPSLDKVVSTQRWLAHSYYTARNKIIFMKKHGKCLLVFLLFYPIYMAFYIFTALRYGRPSEVKNFLRGAIDGFSHY